MTTLRMIAGLGNPEEKYLRTLHNAGFWFVDELARKFGGSFKYEKKFDADCCKIEIGGNDIWLVKPQRRSGTRCARLLPREARGTPRRA